MDKSNLRNFAIGARRELIEKVSIKALQYGIERDKIKSSSIVSSDSIIINGKPLTKEQKLQRERLIEKIVNINNEGGDGYKHVIEEVAYTWFNRFTALRFMEINNYLPTRVRVLSSIIPESIEPDIVREASNINLLVDKEKVYQMKLENDLDGLFKYMVILQCNALEKTMPFMFEKIGHYTELLFPDGLLNEGSFVRRLTDKSLISEDTWQQVEVIGWLYQYYISEEKQRIFDNELKRGKEEIPAATQIFTPDWIVKYMVQNTLGRYWVEGHPEDDEMKKNWEFFLETSQQIKKGTKELEGQINKKLKIEEIRCFDPACGSGHILLYLFDLLYEIYEKCGYMSRQIPKLIIENNLYGIDIDDRAYQLACFSVFMKGMQYNPLLLREIERDIDMNNSKGMTLHIASIQETNELKHADICYIANSDSDNNYIKVSEFIKSFSDAKIYGSLVEIHNPEVIEFLEQRLDFIETNPAQDILEEVSRKKVLKILPALIKQAKLLIGKYDILVSNPPYIGNRDMCDKLSDFVKEHYPNAKEDIFSAFMEYSMKAVTITGHLGFMTPFVWMFISSYEKLRSKIIETKTISSLVQLEYSAFTEATVPICTFTLRNNKLEIPGEFIRLTNFPGAEKQSVKVIEAVKNPQVAYRYCIETKEFNRIKGKPIGYWATDRVREIFENEETIQSVAEPRVGLQTGSNERFLRLWYEIDFNKIKFDCEKCEDTIDSNFKWYPYNKGGDFRKWYGNNEWIVNWENDGREIRSFTDERGKLRSRPQNRQYYFKEGITWSDVSSSYFGVRYSQKGFIFDVKGSSMFPKEGYNTYLILAILASKVVSEFLKILNPTISFQVGDLKRLPIIHPEKEQEKKIIELTQENIQISKDDWDDQETSWHFTTHPFVKFRSNLTLLEQIYEKWFEHKEDSFKKLKNNEETLNRILISLYGLENECSPEIEDKYVTVRRADKERDVKLFISYAIGCMTGRYSLDQDGLIFAGGEFDNSKYIKFKCCKDNIIPVIDDENSHFEYDIVNKFIEFVSTAFGENTLKDNIRFIAQALKPKNNEEPQETLRRYFINEFYKDHLNTYKSTNKRSKAPIYMMFTSGPLRAFNCIVYLHRYTKDTLSRIRTDYLHEVEARLDSKLAEEIQILNSEATVREKNNAKKQINDIEKKIEEIKKYDEILRHLADKQIQVDLDKGVVENFKEFEGLVVKIK